MGHVTSDDLADVEAIVMRRLAELEAAHAASEAEWRQFVAAMGDVCHALAAAADRLTADS